LSLISNVWRHLCQQNHKKYNKHKQEGREISAFFGKPRLLL